MFTDRQARKLDKEDQRGAQKRIILKYEPRHEKRDTNDIRIVLRGGQSKIGMPI